MCAHTRFSTIVLYIYMYIFLYVYKYMYSSVYARIYTHMERDSKAKALPLILAEMLLPLLLMKYHDNRPANIGLAAGEIINECLFKGLIKL